ncbi:host-nuclease inhibitor Gam family protein [Sporocytophaga myxococcoides]|uniref:host-nuclease inhibitor Gam family protein n=1 Tax=Sporocytophaga myxococcoides TaxID=153721 RepID=UPI0004146D4B|nr:host-nuclease inhibitor Gam family protein [Sporocytophaga myxococcoides]
MTRIKKTLSGPVNRTAAEEIFADFALASTRHNQLLAKKNEEISFIEKKYKEEIQQLQEQQKIAFEALHSYAESHREEFKGKKSIKFQDGVLGFRTGAPKLKTRKGYTWSSVTNLLKEFLPDYIRKIEEPAKDRLLADRNDPEVKQMFDKIGIFVDQDETFYINTKKGLSQ